MPRVATGLNHSSESQPWGLTRSPRSASSSESRSRQALSQVSSRVSPRSRSRTFSSSLSGKEAHRRAGLRLVLFGMVNFEAGQEQAAKC
jgi:hypothetical protein